MTVDQKAQVANAREEQQMSNENDEQNRAEVACPRCEGCGQLADSDDREPWSVWTALPVGSALAVTMGLVKPEPCDECGGTGKATAQPAAGTATARTGAPATTDLPPASQAVSKRLPEGEHHTGTLDLTGEGNAPGSPISDEAVAEIAGRMFDGDLVRQPQLVQDRVWRDAHAALAAAYPAIRQQVAEEIAAEMEGYTAHYPEDIFPPDGESRDAIAAAAMRHAYPNAARIAREIGGVA